MAKPALLEACDELDRRLLRLRDSKGRVADEIHEIRKLGKRLRGALMIAGEPKPCIRWVGVIGSMLGAPRDAVVREQTWRLLGVDPKTEDSIEAVIGALLSQQARSAARRPPPEVVAWGRAAAGQVRARIEGVSPDELTRRCGQGARQLMRRLRKRLKRAVSEAEDRDFHAARKASKAWLGGITLLEPELKVAAGEALKELGEVLGQENDLEVFGEWLNDNGFSPATAPRVWKRLPKVQSKARRTSLQLIRREVLPALKKA